jgi:hypothetical protein
MRIARLCVCLLFPSAIFAQDNPANQSKRGQEPEATAIRMIATHMVKRAIERPIRQRWTDNAQLNATVFNSPEQ